VIPVVVGSSPISHPKKNTENQTLRRPKDAALEHGLALFTRFAQVFWIDEGLKGRSSIKVCHRAATVILCGFA
jgi:hypothetical protein